MWMLVFGHHEDRTPTPRAILGPGPKENRKRFVAAVRLPALRYLAGPLITADKSDNIRTSSWYLSAERGTEAGTCTLICAKVQSEWSAVQSQIENYRAKAKEFARLSVIAKSLRHSRQYRKLAEMYWALALGEDPKCAKPSEMQVKRTT